MSSHSPAIGGTATEHDASQSHAQDVARPRPAILRPLLVRAIAVGLLMGVAEVCWSYQLPARIEGWRAVLPETLSGFLMFCGAAMLTNAALMLAFGLALALIIVVLRRLSSWMRGVADWRTFATLATLWFGLSFLYAGWMIFFVLTVTDRASMAYHGTIVGGVVAALLLSVLIAWSGAAARRRLRVPVLGGIWALAAAAFLLTAVPAFSRYAGLVDQALSPPVGEPETRPNILLVTLDTLRYDFVGCNGNPWIETPTLDALARDGVNFDEAISQSPTTTPSHCSIMTSVYPTAHEALNGKPMIEGLVTLADVLNSIGYETIAFTSSTTTRSINTGLHQGFERYVDSLVPWSQAFSRDDFQNLLLFYFVGIAQRSEIRGDVVTDRALAWLNQRSARPFFCWLHYFDPHDPYDAPPPFRDKYAGQLRDSVPMRVERERYAAEVSFTDQQLGRFIDALKQHKLYDDTLIIVVSDHGEAFGEVHWAYTDVGHGMHLYDTTQHVPLFVKPIEGLRGARVSEQVELIDLAPTVLATIGMPVPDAFRGKPLDELIEGRPFSYLHRPAYSMTWIEGAHPDDPEGTVAFIQRFARRTRKWKYITVPHFEQQQLYNLPRDPIELHNVFDRHLEQCEYFLQDLRDVLQPRPDAQGDPRARIAPALRKQLQSLGYIGGDTGQN